MNFESLPYNKLQTTDDSEDFNSFDSFFSVSETNVYSDNPPKVVLTPIPKPIFQSKPIQGTITRPVRYFDIDAAFQGIGYFCMNNGDVTGQQASIVLHYIFEKFPSVVDLVGQNYTTDNRIKVKFGIAKEVVETKKVIKNNRGKSPSKVEYGSSAVRKIYVQNDKGTDNGYPKENRNKYNSSLTCDIYDHKNIEMLYVGNTCVFPLNYKVTVLQTQATTKNGKDRSHKSNSSYENKTHGLKSKMSTGVRLASGIQKGINTNLMSPLFKLPQFKYQVQLQILDNGVVQLNQFLPDGSKMLIDVGSITGMNQQTGIYEIDYNASFQLTGNKQIHDQLQRLISKASKTECSFLRTQNRETDNQFQIDRKEELLAAKRARYDGRHSAYHVRKKMFKIW